MHLSAGARSMLLCVFVAVVWFGNLQYRDLFQADEGRYAEIPREMVATGDWITPRLDGFKYFEKPALQYWITAAVYKVAGQHNWTARLWTALAGFLGLGLAWYAGGRLFDRRSGFYAALMLAGSVYYLAMGHFNTLDMGLTLFMGASLFAFLIAQDGSGDRPGGRGHTLAWMLAAWAAAALGLLTKGLEVVAIPAIALVLYSLTQRDWRVWRRLHILPGLAVFLAIAAPWFVVVSLRNPDFFHFFFVVQHFERYLTPIARRYGAWWYFVPILALGVLPWVWQAVRALVAGAGAVRSRDGRFNHAWFLWLWVVVVFLFFSGSDSKLGSYILPLFPALALLIGRELAGHDRRGIISALAVTLVIGCGCAAYAVGWLPTLHRPGVPTALYARLAPWVTAASGLLIAAAIAGLALARRRPGAVIAGLALTWLVSGQVIMSGIQVLSPVYSARSLVRQLEDIDTRGVPFYSVRAYQQSLPFYLKRTVTPIHYLGELRFGIKRRREPARYIDSMTKFKRRWRTGTRAFAMMPRGVYHKLAREGLPMRVVARDPRRVVVVNNGVTEFR